ncbi:MAG: glycine betaine ABC transporter substrate-binding protein [Parvibaculaceae bacterium]
MNNILRRGASRRTFLKAGGAAALAAGGLVTTARAQESRPMVYAYANWSDALAITFVGAKLIEDNFGYKVQPLQSEPAVIYTSLQSGKADVFSNSYMQGMGALKGEFVGGQAEFVKKVADHIEVVGVSEGPMTQGLAVPDYVDIKSIAELNDHADKFKGSIIGIDPGSGLMQSADATVKAYGLKLNLVAGSEAAMAAAFQRAYSRNEWVVVTTWEPLPMWSKFKMRYLEDPKQTMMQEPYNCFHVVVKDFKSNFPKAHEFFKKFHIPNEEEAKIMAMIDEGSSPQDAAAKWIESVRGKGIIEPWLA